MADAPSASKKSRIEENAQRARYISWDQYFMGIVFLSAKKSELHATQRGACIVNRDNRVVGIGYDEMLNRYVCHAEKNAILNKNISDLKNCIMYVSLFPCNECAKFIIQSGITKVVYISGDNDNMNTRATKKMFEAADVEYKQIEKNVDIDVTDSCLNLNFF